MSGPFGSSQWMYQSARDFYEFPIEQSLKFNDNDSSYLSWTPASAGDRRTWTWSGWVKRGTLGTTQFFLAAGTGGTDDTQMGLNFQADDTLRFTGQATQFRVTSQVFRDTSAWYHIVLQFDTLQAVANDRLKIYVNGEQITNFSTNNALVLNGYYAFNQAAAHNIGRWTGSGYHFDGYLAEVNFIDGQALDASSFGEFKSGVWIPKDPSNLTYGTNGFRLSFQNDTVSEGFNAVTYTGNGGTQSINGIGFAPDLVWGKARNDAISHNLFDSVRGGTQQLVSNTTAAEVTRAGNGVTFNSDGFGLDATYCNINNTNVTNVAWCWDAGSGSPVSNTDGSITSTVKANTDYGMSIVTWDTPNPLTLHTVGHGLNEAPAMIIIKDRDSADSWIVYHQSVGAGSALILNQTTAAYASSNYFGNTAPTSSVFSVGDAAGIAAAGDSMVAYCFSEKSGYSKAGSYTGTGANGNAINLGWKPAFVLVKKSSNTGAWSIFDANRYDADNNYHLNANTSDAEYTDMVFQFTDTGFTVGSTGGMNHSGETFVYLAIKDTRDNAFWRDQSGNGNDWQPNNLTYQDSLPDSTTNNFNVFNAITPSNSVLSEGNLKQGNTASLYNINSTFSMPSGKWYAEFCVISTDGYYPEFGILPNSANFLANATMYQLARGFAISGGSVYVDGSLVGSGYTGIAVAGTIVGIAYDADTREVRYSVNGVWQNSGNAVATLSTTYEADGYSFSASGYTSAQSVANFGQDSSFAGNKPAQGNTDDNGIGDFYYAPPSGYLALCTANLPDPVIDPAQDDVPSDYFNTVLYTGSVSSVTGVGFQPDWTWIKQRSGPVRRHHLQDAVRGAGKSLFSNDTTAEETSVNYLTSFDADGFSLGGSSEVNGSGLTYVAWNWLAGNGTSSNTDGSITSTVSVNQKAGFSVVSYTGNGTAGATVGHGLGAVPNVIIVKNRDLGVNNWWVYHSANTSAPETDFLSLNTTAATSDNNTIWNDTAPTSSVFTVGSANNGNANGTDIIAYCFAEVEGYSKFGSYTGNGSTDGPFVYTGFRPAFVIFKATNNASSWVMQDNARDLYNPTDKNLYANLSNAEDTGDRLVDFLSNGFKPRLGTYDPNKSGYNYIYMAFAEMPAKYSLGR